MKLITPILLVSMLLFCITSCKKEKSSSATKEKPTYALENDLKVALCVYPNGWIKHANAPQPMEGKGSPFDTSSTTNGIFHQWSWQKFLWLTKPTKTANQTLPLFLNDQSIFQVTDLMEKVPQQSGASIVLEYHNQAGSDGVLKTNSAYNNTSKTVLYSIHTNTTMMTAAEAFKPIINKSKDSVNFNTFPVGSLELKVSWVETSTIPKDKLKNYFTTIAAVSDNSKTPTFKNVEVALLGMHVVGVVENHPEFIWATFEHDDMAPNYDWTSNSASATTDKLLFANGSVSGIDAITWDSKTQSPKTPQKAYDLFQYGVPVNSTGFMNTCQQEPLNYNNIGSINSCAKGSLKDLWTNYFYNGSVWINTDGITGTLNQAKFLVKITDDFANANPGKYARGSLNCANVSMETYTQTFNNSIDKVNVNTLVSCFSCHSPKDYNNQKKSPLFISHVFEGYIQSSQGKPRVQIELEKSKQEKLLFLK
jgi:hypothetical protein